MDSVSTTHGPRYDHDLYATIHFISSYDDSTSNVIKSPFCDLLVIILRRDSYSLSMRRSSFLVTRQSKGSSSLLWVVPREFLVFLVGTPTQHLSLPSHHLLFSSLPSSPIQCVPYYSVQFLKIRQKIGLRESSTNWSLNTIFLT